MKANQPSPTEHRAADPAMPPDLADALAALQAADTELATKRARVRDLQAAHADRQTKAEQADLAEAAHLEQFNTTLRDDAADKAELHNLMGRRETERALAAELRRQMAELEIDLGFAEIEEQRAGKAFRAAQRKALEIYSEGELLAVLDAVASRLLRVIKLKALAISPANAEKNSMYLNDVSDIDAAFYQVTNALRKRLPTETTEILENEDLKLVFETANLSGIKFLKHLQEAQQIRELEARRKALQTV